MKNMVIDLGYVVAKTKEKNTRWGDGQLIFLCPDDAVEAIGYVPAQTIRVTGEDNIRKLRDMLNEALDGDSENG